MWGFTTDSLKKTKKAKSQNAIVDQKVALQKENTLLTKALLDYQFKFQEIKKKLDDCKGQIVVHVCQKKLTK